MTAPPPGWSEAAVAFLTAHLPREAEGGGWDHVFLSAYQMGCAALVGLGQTREVDGGAVPLDFPRLPDPLPRWDDVCVAVVGLARQQHLLAFRRRDGTPAPRRGGSIIVQRDAPPPVPPNVAAAHGLGPALADPPRHPQIVSHLDLPPPREPGALRTLERLGLVAGGAWTTAAEPVMWRVGVTDWARAVEDDPRLFGAVDHAVETLPEAIRSEIAALAAITDDDLADLARQHRDWREQARRDYGPKARLGQVPDAAGLRKSLESARRNALDWVFYRLWRYPDGWLSPAEAARALPIFHDPLARLVRGRVLALLHPDRPEMAAP